MRHTHPNDADFSSPQPVTGLAAEQRKALAKIYRLLLSLKKRGKTGNGAREPQSTGTESHPEERQQVLVERLDD